LLNANYKTCKVTCQAKPNSNGFVRIFIRLVKLDILKLYFGVLVALVVDVTDVVAAIAAVAVVATTG
jgi:hypothetical protein